MNFLNKNQFKLATVTVLLVVICIIIFLVLPKSNNSDESNYYTVRFNGALGSNISNQFVLEGGKINEPKEPVKEGYIFLGWYLGDAEYNFENGVYENITLEAKWKKDGEEEPEELPDNSDDENSEPSSSKPSSSSSSKPSSKPSSRPSSRPSSSSSKPSSPSKVNVASITLNKTNITLEVGNSDTLIATVKPDNATNKTVKWISSNNNVVTVTNGVVKAIGAGSATITATADGKSITCTITVNKKITYSYEWQKIESSSVGEYYLYIVSSEGKKVSGKVNVKYNNNKSKEQDVPTSGLKLIKSAVSSVEIVKVN